MMQPWYCSFRVRLLSRTSKKLSWLVGKGVGDDENCVCVQDMLYVCVLHKNWEAYTQSGVCPVT